MFRSVQVCWLSESVNLKQKCKYSFHILGIAVPARLWCLHIFPFFNLFYPPVINEEQMRWEGSEDFPLCGKNEDASELAVKGAERKPSGAPSFFFTMLFLHFCFCLRPPRRSALATARLVFLPAGRTFEEHDTPSQTEERERCFRLGLACWQLFAAVWWSFAAETHFQPHDRFVFFFFISHSSVVSEESQGKGGGQRAWLFFSSIIHSSTAALLLLPQLLGC